MVTKPAKTAEILQRECKTGYCDSAVFGGFSTWLYQYAAALSQDLKGQLQALAQEYAAAPLVQRPALLQRIASLLPVDAGPVKEAVNRQRNASPAQKKAAKSSRPAKNVSGPGERQATLQYLKGVGPKRAVLLQRLGLNKPEDVLQFYPRDYEDRGTITPIATLAIAQNAVIRGKVLKAEEFSSSRKLHILKVYLQDDSGIIPAVWFNQKHLSKQLAPGCTVTVYGRLDYKYRQAEFMVLDYQLAGKNDSAKFAGLLPVYRATEGLNQKFLRQLVAQVWQQYQQTIEETLPQEVLEQQKLPGRREAMAAMHFPHDRAEQERGRRRLAYEELLLLQLAILAGKRETPQRGLPRASAPGTLAAFCRHLAFPLTGAQRRTIEEIFADLASPEPMARLVQGDVGCGKTVVAAAALYQNFLDGYQGAFMAPTEILAQQHFETLSSLWQSLGMKAALLTGQVKGAARRRLLSAVANGEVDVLVGTHALIQEGVEIPKLGLAITDEQHRFGVAQRSRLAVKAGSPDVLVMTATPIPRTLALTFYGDLRLSLIDEMPPGRQTIKTYAVGHEMEQRIFNFIKKEVDQGRQAYIVCPLVEESEKVDLQSAAALAKRLQQQELKDYQVGLLHGKLKSSEKESLMQAFSKGELQVLVSTTVIEVGINVPNATLMVVWDAHRFGLAQLHQLRGRVGRGSQQSYCILMYQPVSQVASERMAVMTQTNDGFAIAEADLKLRGPGELFGTKQHGLPELKAADLVKDAPVLLEARQQAERLLAQPGFLQDTPLGRRVRQKLQTLN